jgi:ADP-ribose pyrophosphatase
VTAGDEVLLVRQYKHGLRRVILEFPGGYLDTPEDPLTCAQRELREETGFEARSWKPLGAFALDANRSPNRGHFFLARDLIPSVKPPHHPTEDLVVLAVPIRQVPALLNSGELATQAAAAGWGLAANELLRS